MNASIPIKTYETAVGARVFAPVPAERLYEAVLDVRGFPAWAPGVRRVEVLAGDGEPGMLSEWEVSLLGLRRRVRSVLEEAEAPAFLRWTYEGPVEGWGECFVERAGGGALAEFRTVLSPADPLLAGLTRSPAVKGMARDHLKRSLVRLGRLVAGDEARVSVGPPSAAKA
jgi:polyketide cyclase/dehydrase/lipid transport protein